MIFISDILQNLNDYLALYDSLIVLDVLTWNTYSSKLHVKYCDKKQKQKFTNSFPALQARD